MATTIATIISLIRISLWRLDKALDAGYSLEVISKTARVIVSVILLYSEAVAILSLHP